jgi:hypothetical protein
MVNSLEHIEKDHEAELLQYLRKNRYLAEKARLGNGSFHIPDVSPAIRK